MVIFFIILVTAAMVYYFSNEERSSIERLELMKIKFSKDMATCGISAEIEPSGNETIIIIREFSYGLKQDTSKVDIPWVNKSELPSFSVAFKFKRKLFSNRYDEWAMWAISAMGDEIYLYGKGQHFFTSAVLFNAESDGYIPYKQV